jgi:small subunit ribosomal protein S17
MPKDKAKNDVNKQTLIGVVRKKSGDQTISVTVERFIKHPVYKKFYRSSKNYPAHDQDNQAEVGDRVEIVETRPISKTKRFKLSNIISKAQPAE